MRAFARAMALLGVAGAASAQEAPSTTAAMQAFATAVQELERALDRDTTNPAATAKIVDTASGLAGAARFGPGGTRWLTAVRDRARALGSAPDAALRRHDFALLRRACTSCHLEVRDDNAARGLFPNRGNALHGRIELLARDGAAHEDRGGVVVFLEGDALPPSPPAARKPVISQQGRQFAPRVLTVTRGTVVRFPNDDVVFHNVFSKSKTKAFDLGTYGKGRSKEVAMDRAGLVKVHCNIHPQMSASVLVLENDRATVTDERGYWAIPDVPDGRYRLRVWHALGMPPPTTIEVHDGIAQVVPLTVRETRARVQHTNKHGKRYRKKY